MRTVSNSEFLAHPEIYLNMAVEQDVRIQHGREVFYITYAPSVDEQPILAPDDDFRNAITAEELLKGIHEDISRKFAARQA